jgi:hypothetical protein
MEFLLAYVLCWVCASAFWLYRALTGAKPELRALSRFYITDFWAAVVGLLPSFLALRLIFLSNGITAASALIALTLLAASQCLGMFILKITDTPRSGTVRINRWNSAKSILAGAVVGLAWILFVAMLTMLFVLVLWVISQIVVFGLMLGRSNPMIAAIELFVVLIVIVVIVLLRKKTPD